MLLLLLLLLPLVQRNRKYESLRWRYTDYYLSLLRTCEDLPHTLELSKWCVQQPACSGSPSTQTQSSC